VANVDLSRLRDQIDGLDEQIQSLLNQRAELAKSVAKAKYAVEDNPDFYRPEREADVLNKVRARNQGPLSNDTLTHFFKEIMSASLALQKPLKIAYLGPSGTYSEAAAYAHFGSAMQPCPLQTIKEVFRQVQADEAQYGIVPIENSTEGGVTQTLDLFLHSPLKIAGEVDLAIHHCLLSKQTEQSEIKVIYSHPQSLAQCRIWLAKHLPHIETLVASSNAEAARLAAEQTEAAAIAGANAAALYDLSILAENIEDEPENTTRFAVIGKQTVVKTAKNKTSLVLSTHNQAGSLHELLGCFSRNQINLSRVESRPAHHIAWNYVFFIDFEGHIDDPAVQETMRQLVTHCTLLKHLGSYPVLI